MPVLRILYIDKHSYMKMSRHTKCNSKPEDLLQLAHDCGAITKGKFEVPKFLHTEILFNKNILCLLHTIFN